MSQNQNMSNWIKLDLNQAYLTLNSLFKFPIQIHHSSNICEHCPEKLIFKLNFNESKTIIIDTDYSQNFILTSAELITQICSYTEYFKEFGNYIINISGDSIDNVICSEVNYLGTVSTNYKNAIPSTLIAIFSFLFIFYHSPKIFRFIYQYLSGIRKRLNSSENITLTSNIKQNPILVSKIRVTSLDAFRGLNVILMLFVNSGGGGYTIFSHKTWNGFSIAELPHGWFNWIMGVSFALSSSYDRKTKSAYERLEAAVHRTTKLFFIGLIASSASFSADLAKIPFTGVLQNLGALYLFAAVLDILLPRKQSLTKRNKLFSIFALDTLWPQWLVLLSAIASHNLILFAFHVPNCGRGYLGPGGIHLNGKFENCTGGAAGYIERILMSSHTSFRLHFMHIYNTQLILDPYGPIGLIGQIVQVYFGILAGEMFLLHKRNSKTILKKWLLMSISLAILSLCLCNEVLDYCFIPCCRILWTLTFSCYICSSAFLVLSLLHFIIDVKKLWSGWPLLYPGANSVFLYTAHIIFTVELFVFPFNWPTPKLHHHLLFKNIYQVCLWVYISSVMYHKKLFLKV